MIEIAAQAIYYHHKYLYIIDQDRKEEKCVSSMLE